MMPLYIFLGIWVSLGLWAWTFIEWFSIKEKYRVDNLRKELSGIRIWECLAFCIVFGPLAFLIILPP